MMLTKVTPPTIKTSLPPAATGVSVLQRKQFKEDPKLVGELVKLRGALAQGNAISGKAGIDIAVREDGGRGFPTQFKYELGDDGKLSLSIYTVKEGRNVLPEKSHTTERAGSPLSKQWEHGADVFGAKGQDDEHVSRSAGFLTLMQETHVSIKQVIDQASRYGLVYRVEPEVFFKPGSSRGHAAFNVTVLTASGKTEQLKLKLPVTQ